LEELGIDERLSEMNLHEVGWGDRVWIDLAWDRDR
jgi:hypothetical protein